MHLGALSRDARARNKEVPRVVVVVEVPGRLEEEEVLDGRAEPNGGRGLCGAFKNYYTFFCNENF